MIPEGLQNGSDISRVENFSGGSPGIQIQQDLSHVLLLRREAVGSITTTEAQQGCFVPEATVIPGIVPGTEVWIEMAHSATIVMVSIFVLHTPPPSNKGSHQGGFPF